MGIRRGRMLGRVTLVHTNAHKKEKPKKNKTKKVDSKNRDNPNNLTNRTEKME